MAEFMRPTVTTEEVNDTVARFIVEPLERGFGYTLEPKPRLSRLKAFSTSSRPLKASSKTSPISSLT